MTCNLWKLYSLNIIERWSINEVVIIAARKAVDQELNREIILDVARDMFVKHGYRHLSMRQIAKELNYSHGAIYYHFKNKAELFYSLVRQGFLKLDRELELLLSEEIAPQQKLENVLLGFIQFGFRNPSHYEVMFLVKDEEVDALMQEEPNISYQKFASAIHTLCEGKVNIHTIWSIFLSLHGFVAHLLRAHQAFEDVEPMAKVHVQFLLKALE